MSKITKPLKQLSLRVVESGEVIETYTYEKPIDYGFENNNSNNNQGVRDKPENWEGKDDFSLQRSRQTIRRVIWSNITKYSKFLTLTYRENMKSPETFYYDFEQFIRNLKRKGYKLKYLYVLEYQERGAIHCHLVVFNEEYIPTAIIEKCWGKGFVKINQIKDVKNLGSYVCKYLTKETLSEYNSKSFHTSRGLKRPVETKISLQDSVNTLEGINSTAQLVYDAEFDIKYNDIVANKVEYRQYKKKPTRDIE